MNTCNSFKNCNASLCPVDNCKISDVWYPSEPVCTMSGELFVKNQRKIKTKAKDDSTCFTYEMLNRRITIKSGIKGIDPEKDINEESLKWIAKHPEKKEISEERRKELSQRMAKCREFKPKTA